MRKSGKVIFIVSVVAAVVAAVLGGLILLGPPAQERMRRLDARRVDDLRAIASAADLYWTQHGSLPHSFEELSRTPGVSVRPFDLETGQLYEYKVLNSKNYELCAQFARDTAEGTDTSYKGFWSHGTGRQCFHLEARNLKR